jgi:hypothetical protein
MSEVWSWFQANQAAMIGLAMILGGLIVKATPTKVDDAWWQKIKGLFSK